MIGHWSSCWCLSSLQIQTKNRSVCETAVTGIWGSCRLLAMASLLRPLYIPMVIPLKLFLYMIPSSAADNVTTRVAWMFRGWKYVRSRLGCPREKNCISGLAVSEATWNVQIRQWHENNLRGITLEIRPVWGIYPRILHSLLAVWYYTLSMFSRLFFDIKDCIYGFRIRDGKANVFIAASKISYPGKESKASESLITRDSPQRQHSQ